MEELTLEETKKEWHGSLKSYIIGFTVSLIFTSLSFLFVAGEFFSVHTTIYTISAFALTQALIQLRYFLHLGKEGKPHWETIIFVCMFSILVIIVGGSLWILYNLDVRTKKIIEEVQYHD